MNSGQHQAVQSSGGGIARTVRQLIDPFEIDDEGVEELSDAVVVLDAGARITSWNRAAEELYGIAATDVLGHCFADFVSVEPRPLRKRTGPGLFPAPESIGSLEGQATHVMRSGRRIPVRVSPISFHTGTGDRRHVLVVRDDTDYVRLAESLGERLDCEMLLAELSARFSHLSEEDIDQEVEAWLARLVKMLGVDRASFAELTPTLGLTVTHSYAVPDIQSSPVGPVEHALPWLTGELKSGRTVVLSHIPDDLPAHATEERRYFTESGMKAGIGIPTFVAGNLVCVLTFGAFRNPRAWSPEVVSRLQLAGDVFANAIIRRQSKQRLEQKQQELAHVGRVAAMGELASVIAHELDQPLTAAVTNAQAVRNMLRSGQPDLSEADDALKDVVDAVMRVSEIARRERRLLRKPQGVSGQVDLNDALREVELFIRAEARQSGLRVTLELAPELPAVAGDRVQLQQVALNLARNGLQAMTRRPGAGNELTIRTACAAPGQVILSVSDCGPPVEESVLEQMFEPFYSTKPDGLGMGLSISRSIVDRHRGRLWPTRNTGGGLTMYLALPRTGAT